MEKQTVERHARINHAHKPQSGADLRIVPGKLQANVYTCACRRERIAAIAAQRKCTNAQKRPPVNCGCAHGTDGIRTATASTRPLTH